MEVSVNKAKMETEPKQQFLYCLFETVTCTIVYHKKKNKTKQKKQKKKTIKNQQGQLFLVFW